MSITINKKRAQLFRVGQQYANHSQRQRWNRHDREWARKFLRCNIEEIQLSIATAPQNIFPVSRRKGRRGAGSIRKWAVKRLYPALSAHNHHRFILSIGQHGSILLQEIHLPRVTTSCIRDGADIPIWKWQYQLIYFSLSPILSYYITTRRDNTVKEKGLVL